MKNQVLILCILLGACAQKVNQSQDVTSQPTQNANSFSPNNAAMSLADYLKRVPGLQVIQSGTKTQVTVRGQNSMSGTGEPLFIINGVNVGFGYENAEPLVAITDIDRVQVLKSGQETAMYGMQGNNGVIIIKTKK